ncbi:MAG: ion transporter, partial [Bdellovibrionales bacterium]|nr:ion transporter [Bdellovibrionales bacterium]
MRSNLQRFLAGPAFNSMIALLIVFNVGLIFYEFMLPEGPLLTRVASVNDFITAIFVVELTLRYIVAPNKRIYLSNYWIDILSCLPALRVFRTFRVLRLLRLLRLTRAVMILIGSSGWVSRRFEMYFGSFGVLFITTMMLILCGTLALLSVEQESAISPDRFLSEVWRTTFLFMSGEMIQYPTTNSARFVAALISLAGLIVFAVLVGTVSASMTAYFARKMEAKELELGDLKNHVIICGWERMGAILLAELEAIPEVWARGVVVVAETESDIAKEAGVKNPTRLFHIRDDYTKIGVLESVGARRAKTAIVLADKGVNNNLQDQDRDARTVLAALTLEKLNPNIFTCAELLNQANATHLKIAGVEEVINRSVLTAGLLAASAVNEGLTPIITDLMTHREGNCLRKLSLPKELVGKPFSVAFKFYKLEYDAMA